MSIQVDLKTASKIELANILHSVAELVAKSSNVTITASIRINFDAKGEDE